MFPEHLERISDVQEECITDRRTDERTDGETKPNIEMLRDASKDGRPDRESNRKISALGSAAARSLVAL